MRTAKSLAIVLGTRPEIIKLSPVIRACEARDVPFYVVHSNQHYDANLDRVFFEELQLRAADVNLNVGSASHAVQTGQIMAGVEATLTERPAAWVVVQGDTNTVLAGALAAAKLKVPVAHVEAGLRSYDRAMPEEINRIVADAVSDALFCPTETQARILRDEGIPDCNIHVVGNTIVDAVREAGAIAALTSSILERLGLAPRSFAVLTAHRPANVDTPEHLSALLAAVQAVAEACGLCVLYPMHPRTARRLRDFGLGLPPCVRGLEPTGYLDFLQLLSNARLVMTDSGGIQEEACIMRIPCITLRENTERPETLDVGANRLVGLDRQRAVAAAQALLAKQPVWTNPFGDGHSGAHIVELLSQTH
jgi:UDP-N-acetylglucosamine 2-epimerase (non-hydrolysing)